MRAWLVIRIVVQVYSLPEFVIAFPFARVVVHRQGYWIHFRLNTRSAKSLVVKLEYSPETPDPCSWTLSARAAIAQR